MVSLSYYMKTFMGVIPKRVKKFEALIKEKNKIDKELFNLLNKQNKDSLKDLETSKNLLDYKLNKSFELISKIIGKDTLFRKAEKKSTIRHYLWKNKKSLNYYLNLDKSFILKEFKEVDSEIKDSRIVNLYNFLEEKSKIFLELSNELDKNFEMQIKSIEKKDLREYLILISKQGEILNKYNMKLKVPVNLKNDILHFVNKYNNFDMSSIDSGWGGSKDHISIMINHAIFWFIISLCAFTTIAMVGSWFEYGIGKIKPIPVDLIWYATFSMTLVMPWGTSLIAKKLKETKKLMKNNSEKFIIHAETELKKLARVII